MKFSSLLEESIGEINSLLEQEGLNTLPDLFKHMVVAIFRKGDRTEANFRRALDAAFKFLLRNGHITPDSTVQNMNLTGTGRALNARHQAEPKAKSDTFDASMDVLSQK